MLECLPTLSMPASGWYWNLNGRGPPPGRLLIIVLFPAGVLQRKVAAFARRAQTAPETALAVN